MPSFQQTIIVGNVGRDVNFKYTQSGVPVADFSVAVTEKFGGKDGKPKQEKTTWFRVTCWRQMAETANQYVKKGMQIMIVGDVSVSSYLDKAGQPAATLELTADTMQFLGSKNGNGDNDASAGGSTDYAPAAADNMADVPF